HLRRRACLQQTGEPERRMAENRRVASARLRLAGWPSSARAAAVRAPASCRQPPTQVITRDGSGCQDQVPGVVDLTPGIPQEDAFDELPVEVVGNGFRAWFVPIDERVEPGVEYAERFVAVVEQIGVEEGQVRVGRF